MNVLPPDDLNLLIVFTCYRAVDLTIDCLHSLADQINNVPKTKVAICENGTSEVAVQQLKRAIVENGWSDWVTLKAIHPNLGFAGGNNAILRDVLAWPTPPRYCMLLNCDTIVKPGAIRALYGAIEADPAVGIMGPQLIGPEEEAQRTCFRYISPLSELLRAAGIGAVNHLFARDDFELAPPRDETQFDWVSFAAVIIRREVLQQVGLLDQGYFLYFDDIDYCRTAKRIGWRMGYCVESMVVHLEGQSNSVPSDSKAGRRRPRYYYVSRARYLGKHTGVLGLWLANLGWAVGRLIAFTREKVAGRARGSCEGELVDNWTNSLAPVRLSDPEPVDIESRIV